MTDPTAPTAEDVIAGAIHSADCGCTDWHPRDPEDQSYDEQAAAVVAAIRAMTVEQLADLRPDLTIERALFGHDGGHYRTALDAEDEAHLRSMAAQHGGEIRSRVVGPWQETP